MNKPFMLGMIAVLMIFAAGTLQAGPILNGSFEDGSYNSSSAFITLSTGSTAIAGWTVSNGTIDWIGSYWSASDGSKSIDLDGNNPGGISITSGFATILGQQYVLLFDMAGNPDGLPATKTLNVSVGNVSNMPFSFDTTGKTRSNMGWVTQSLTFTATGTTSYLTFTSTTPNYYGPALDNVRVNSVPEPSLMLLLGLGISAVSLIGWARK
jgi:choice-of-anchor C domain-containing protein